MILRCLEQIDRRRLTSPCPVSIRSSRWCSGEQTGSETVLIKLQDALKQRASNFTRSSEQSERTERQTCCLFVRMCLSTTYISPGFQWCWTSVQRTRHLAFITKRKITEWSAEVWFTLQKSSFYWWSISSGFPFAHKPKRINSFRFCHLLTFILTPSWSSVANIHKNYSVSAMTFGSDVPVRMNSDNI